MDIGHKRSMTSVLRVLLSLSLSYLNIPPSRGCDSPLRQAGEATHPARHNMSTPSSDNSTSTSKSRVGTRWRSGRKSRTWSLRHWFQGSRRSRKTTRTLSQKITATICALKYLASTYCWTTSTSPGYWRLTIRLASLLTRLLTRLSRRTS